MFLHGPTAFGRPILNIEATTKVRANYPSYPNMSKQGEETVKTHEGEFEFDHDETVSDSGSEASCESESSYSNGGYHRVKIGDTFGDYTVVSKLGYGQFSTVWCTDKAVALKITKGDPELQNMIQDEIKFMKKLGNHRNILKLHDAWTFDARNGTHSCLVLDLMGMDLFSFLDLFDDSTTMPIPLLVAITRQIFEGLQHMAVHDIVHTDLKPENLLLTRRYTAHDDDFSGINIKIGDFGSGVTVGNQCRLYGKTTYYRSPEVVLGTRRLTPAADVWSAATICFECLAGDYMFNPKETEEYCLSSSGSETSSVDDDIDVEHVALMVEMLGKFPRSMTKSGLGRKYFNCKGLLKGMGQSKHVPIQKILHEDFDIDPGVALEVQEFLTPLLMYNPTRRATAEQVLASPFLNMPTKKEEKKEKAK